MSHLEDETVALAALGEALEQTASDHLVGCGRCSDEVAQLARVVGVGRAGGVDLLEQPPASVWAAIAAETGVRPLRSAPVLVDDARVQQARPSEPLPAQPPVQPMRAGPVRSAPARRWSGSGLLVAASVAGLVVGVGATAVWNALDDDTGDVVATAALEPLPDQVGTGSAEIVSGSSGRELEMSLDAAIPDDAYLQVWLISADVTRMVPVGVIDGPTGHWALPAGVEITDYPIVDVSIEPYDGNPLHSSNSVVRGTLDPAEALGAIGGG